MKPGERKMSNSERSWSPRAFRDGDEEGILELWKAVYPERPYNREQWMKWWHWTYRDNPSGKIRIWVAEHDGKLVGQYAILPMTIKVAEESLAGALSLDTMTHPSYRHQGIFVTLAKEVYAEAQRDGIHIIQGFPNDSSYPGLVTKLNWFYIDTMRALVKPLNWWNALKLVTSNVFLIALGTLAGSLLGRVFGRSKKAPVVEGLTIAQVSRFDERINDFWDRVSHQYQIMVERKREHLNWRYASASSFDYLIYIAERKAELAGYLVLRCTKRKQVRVAIIFDVLAESEEIAQCLIAEAIKRSREEMVDIVYYASTGGKSLAKSLRRSGFMPLPLVKRLQFCAYSTLPDVSRKFLQKPGNWFVQIGDSDTW